MQRPPSSSRARASSPAEETGRQPAVPMPAALTKLFSATRSWVTASTAAPGRTGRVAAMRSTAATGTFSNSSVTTSTAATKRSRAARSCQSARVKAALTSAAGDSASGARMWQR